MPRATLQHAACAASWAWIASLPACGHQTFDLLSTHGDAGSRLAVDAAGPDISPAVDAEPEPKTGPPLERGPCMSDAECGGGFCDGASGQCVECADDGHCPIWQPRCEPSLRRCVECFAPDHCPSISRCDTATYRCTLSCASQDDCFVPRPLCAERGVCVECTDDTHCQSPFSRGSLCWQGACVECGEDAHCPEAAPFCTPYPQRCAACLEDEHCGDGLRCDPLEHRCR